MTAVTPLSASRGRSGIGQCRPTAEQEVVSRHRCRGRRGAGDVPTLSRHESYAPFCGQGAFVPTRQVAAGRPRFAFKLRGCGRTEKFPAISLRPLAVERLAACQRLTGDRTPAAFPGSGTARCLFRHTPSDLWPAQRWGRVLTAPQGFQRPSQVRHGTVPLRAICRAGRRDRSDRRPG
jgi:hypothetical protein